jgi:hypothetical protein
VTAPKHPGEILFVEDGKPVVRSADEVPEAIRFAPDQTGALVPVVRIEAVTTGKMRTIHQYAETGELLRSTLQRQA